LPKMFHFLKFKPKSIQLSDNVDHLHNRINHRETKKKNEIPGKPFEKLRCTC